MRFRAPFHPRPNTPTSIKAVDEIPDKTKKGNLL